MMDKIIRLLEEYEMDRNALLLAKIDAIMKSNLEEDEILLKIETEVRKLIEKSID